MEENKKANQEDKMENSLRDRAGDFTKKDFEQGYKKYEMGNTKGYLGNPFSFIIGGDY